MQTDTYDAQGNLITETQNSPGTSTPAGGGGGGSGTPGAPGAPGSVTYFVNFEPSPGQTVTGYNPQDNLLGPSGTLYPLQTA